MHSNLWLRWWASFSVFIFCHFIYLSIDGNLQDTDRNIFWFGFLAVLDMSMAATLLLCKFRPISSWIACTCLIAALTNFSAGIFHTSSYLVSDSFFYYMMELYGSWMIGITAVQIFLFILGAEEIGSYSRDNNHNIYALSDTKDIKSNGGDLAR